MARQRRTSGTDPLQVARIALPDGGQIGLTLCPGKKQAHSLNGFWWDRDLGADLDVLRDEGWQVVVTLIEEDEMDELGVPDLAKAVGERGMAWEHLPIVDGDLPPDPEAFEALRRRVRARLSAGGRVVMHCKGGLGRAGTMAGVALIDMGFAAVDAIRSVRSARSPHAIEPHQEDWLGRLLPIGEEEPLPGRESR